MKLFNVFFGDPVSSIINTCHQSIILPWDVQPSTSNSKMTSATPLPLTFKGPDDPIFNTLPPITGSEIVSASPVPRIFEGSARAKIAHPSQFTHKINEIKTLLETSTISVDRIGRRYLVNTQGVSIKMDSIVEELKIVSRKYESLSSIDKSNGLECISAMRRLYIQSDADIFAKIRSVFDRLVFIICLPITISRLCLMCCCSNLSDSFLYSQRDSIFADGFYAIGPESIEMNFRSGSFE